MNHSTSGGSRLLGTLSYALAISTAFEIAYYLYCRLRRQSNRFDNVNRGEIEVVFFPDKSVACQAHFTYGCNNPKCWLSHEETSQMKVINMLSSAIRTLDICVYCIASADLIDAVLKSHQNGTVIRVITDQAQAQQQEAQIGKLRAKGIEVRMNDSTFYMHHKFAVADGKTLMTGSFNWSVNATLGNNENLLFISNTDIVNKYQGVFNELWKEYAPCTRQ